MIIGNAFQHGGVMDSVHVTTRGRIIIPVRLRRKLGIKPGTKVCFIDQENDILFQPVTKQYIRSLCGMLKSTTSVTANLLIERKKDREREQGKRKEICQHRRRF
jgi:AbrB family looped-hinge helix DNA binding protein